MIIPQIPKDLFKYIAGFTGIILLVFYSIFVLKINFKTILMLLGFILVGAVSRLPQRMAPVSLGIELVSLVTIVSGILYGPFAGALVGIAASALSGFYTIERPQDIIIMSIGFFFMGTLAPFCYQAFGLGWTALILTCFYDGLTGFAYAFMGHSWAGVGRFMIVHIPVNYLIITWLAPKLLAL
ncbi:MAG: hypothetical protein ABIF92_02585 [archaeon]